MIRAIRTAGAVFPYQGDTQAAYLLLVAK